MENKDLEKYSSATDASRSESRETRLRQICKLNGLCIGKEEFELLSKYVTLLLHWNKKLNLISRQDEKNVWERHILHSTSMLFHLSLIENARVLDLGTGGGLPGIPLKILTPKTSFCLIDSIKKKTVAVENILQELSLADVKVRCGRAEVLSKRQEFNSQFDYVVTRGTGNLTELARWSFSFLGRRITRSEHSLGPVEKMFVPPPALIAMKGGNLESEIAAAQRMNHVKEIVVRDLSIKGLGEAASRDRKAVVVYFH